MRKTPIRLALLAAVTAALAACGQGQLTQGGTVQGAQSIVRSDGSAYSSCDVNRTLSYVNAPTTTVAVLQADHVRKRARENIIAHRDGPDGKAGTADDNLFDSLEELDAVPWVGPWNIEQIANAAPGSCGAATIDVVFSPQPWKDSHLARVSHWIAGTKDTIDVAMYSLSDGTVIQSLEDASRRGVSIRLLLNSAADDVKSPSGTLSAQLEDAGIDVRYINKIMHHKFAIFDGPRRDPSLASQAKVVSGSANWSYGGGTKYDENTLFIQNDPEIALRLQAEFDHLWNNSRDFAWNHGITSEFGNAVSDTDIAAADDPNEDALFTSANFRTYTSSTYGKTFALVSGRSNVSDHLVQMIMAAKKSILISSGHMRSRPIAEALIAKHQQDPSVDIRVVLDDQEHISEGYNYYQQQQHQACLDAATTQKQTDKCNARGFLFSYDLVSAGVGVRFKYYAYRWDYHYALQMHNKFIIIDGSTLATGSYNLSDNAEHGTMENVLIFRGSTYQSLVDAYTADFEKLWGLHQSDGTYQNLLDQVEHGTGAVPLVFTPMALDQGQVDTLKSALAAACPAVNSSAFKTDPKAHQSCAR